MNSTISDDLTREHLAIETAKCMGRLGFENRSLSFQLFCLRQFGDFYCNFSENIIAKSQNVTSLHKELLEINLSFTAFIEESKRRLGSLRLELANKANSSQRVVEILSEKCKYLLMDIYCK